MKTFIEWLRAMVRPTRSTTNTMRRIDFGWDMANRYNGTQDADIAGMWMTFAERESQKLGDAT